MKNIKAIVEERLNTTVSSVKPIGNGNTASCYITEISDSPFKIIIKTSKHYELTYEEKKMNDFLSKKVHFKIPKTYFLAEKDGVSYLAMEYGIK